MQYYLPVDGRIVGLVQHYGNLLNYYGSRNIALWPVTSELNLAELRGNDSSDFEALFHLVQHFLGSAFTPPKDTNAAGPFHDAKKFFVHKIWTALRSPGHLDIMANQEFTEVNHPLAVDLKGIIVDFDLFNPEALNQVANFLEHSLR